MKLLHRGEVLKLKAKRIGKEARFSKNDRTLETLDKIIEEVTGEILECSYLIAKGEKRQTLKSSHLKAGLDLYKESFVLDFADRIIARVQEIKTEAKKKYDERKDCVAGTPQRAETDQNQNA